MSQEALVDALTARIIAAGPFAAGRVVQHDLAITQPSNPSWAKGVAACIVWSGYGEARNTVVAGTTQLLGGTWEAVVEVDYPIDQKSDWVSRWLALIEACKTVIQNSVWASGQNWFDIRVRWADEPPTWRTNLPMRIVDGAQFFFSIVVVES